LKEDEGKKLQIVITFAMDLRWRCFTNENC